MGNCFGDDLVEIEGEDGGYEERKEALKTQFKVLMVGDSSVGKSSLLVRFADDSFSDNTMPTLGIDFKISHLEVNGKRVQLQIWDTAGQERYQTITRAYYRGARGIMICFDVTNLDSYRSIPKWFSESNEYAGPEVPKLLVGTKSDLSANRQISKSEAAALAKSFGMEYLETSAKSKVNIFHSFQNLSKLIAAC